MPGGWLVRLKAVVLSALLLSGGGGMPLLDMVLFHASGATRSAIPHYESKTGVEGHGDLCTQGTALPHAAEGPSAPAVRSIAIVTCTRLGPLEAVLLSTDRSLLPQSRAPPTLPHTSL